MKSSINLIELMIGTITNESTNKSTYTHTHTHTHNGFHIYTHRYMHTTHTDIHTHRCTHTEVNISIYVCAQTQTLTHRRRCIPVYVLAYSGTNPADGQEGKWQEDRYCSVPVWGCCCYCCYFLLLLLPLLLLLA